MPCSFAAPRASAICLAISSASSNRDRSLRDPLRKWRTPIKSRWATGSAQPFFRRGLLRCSTGFTESRSSAMVRYGLFKTHLRTSSTIKAAASVRNVRLVAQSHNTALEVTDDVAAVSPTLGASHLRGA